MASNKRIIEVFSSFKFLLNLCGIYSTKSLNRVSKLKKALAILNIITPNFYWTVCAIWLYIDLKFDTKVVAQSFAILVSGIQGMGIYFYFLTNTKAILEAIDHLQDIVTQRNVLWTI